MAPNPLCLAWREQIIDNLRLISGRSATEVYQFIDANGFSFPRGVTIVSDHRDGEESESSGSEASTVDASDVLSLSAVSSDSEDDNVRKGKKTEFSCRRKSKRTPKKNSKNHDSSSPSEEEEELESNSEPEISPRRRPAAVAPVTRHCYIPAPPVAVSQAPRPPPGWRGLPTRVYPRAPAAGPPLPPPPLPNFPPGMRPPHHQGLAAPTVPAVSAALSKPVRLVIKWRGHGEKKVIEHCAPSHRTLQRTALAHVRSHWQTFENVLPQEMTPGRLWGLGAKVRRVALGKDMYTISAAGGDDLAMYFKAEDIPKFEIEVDHDGSIMPPPPPPQPHSQH
ncbi:hypothetical protein CSPAE12_05063 [Colletotrichum incanum]|nr:hypothetical protein CSPAE12_05063 [Colletotrichum incanum]